MFRRVKAAGRHVWFHSDGFIADIVGDLVEIGVDVLNFQAAVVGFDWTSRNVRGRIAVRTDIDRQGILPFAPPERVKEEVHRTFEACGTPDGGLIACGEIGPDVPLANIRAMYEAFRDFRF
jgi:uroporphyrinogen decarboxylase